MPVHNADIAAIFDEIADLLDIQNANPFRIRAYRNASRQIQNLGRDISTLVAQGEDLIRLPGIGKDLSAKIKEIVGTGKCQTLVRLRKEISPEITELLKIPGLGPKRVRILYDERGICTIEQLYHAALDKRIRDLTGFGVKTEERIVDALEAHIKQDQRIRRAVAEQYAEPLTDYLKKTKGIDQVTIAGSYRRCKETVGDLDILVVAPP